MATDTLCDLDLDIAECLENCPELDVSWVTNHQGTDSVHVVLM